MNETTETTTFGEITIVMTRPPSKLAALSAKVREILGRDLPDEIAAFYARGDGMHIRATRGDQVLPGEASICGLEEAFDEFRPHVQYRSRKAHEKDIDEGDIYAQAFCEQIWSDSFDVETKRDLDRLNALKRSKLIVSVPGESVWLTIDYFDPEGAPYRIGVAHDGCELYPLDLSFLDFVAHFQRFGAAHWYYAFAGKKAAKAMNVDLGENVELSLAPFAQAMPTEVDALVRRARGKR